MKCFFLFLTVGFLTACSGGGGGDSNIIPASASTAATTYVSLTASSSSIYENSSASITLTAILSNAVTETVVVALGTTGTATEGTDYNSISNITTSDKQQM